MKVAPRAPQPPDGLDAKSKALWRLTVKQLDEQGFWQPSDAQTLERYIRALERARHARARIAAGGETTDGSQGQVVAHPDVKILREAELDAHRYAQSLLLTPQARQAAKSDESAKAPAGPSKFGL